MKLIELHIVQSFPVSCLNRDDVGAPKTAVFGGSVRARISSQCLKRAIRRSAREMLAASFAGSRTRKATEDLTEALVRKSWPEAEARKMADDVLHSFLAKEAKKEKKGKNVKKDADGGAGEGAVDGAEAASTTSTLLYFSTSEIELLAEGIHAASKAGSEKAAKNIKDAALKSLGKGLPKDAADIGIFGRMVANAPEITLEGAGMFSHALSSHKTDNDLDFWTAVDDEKTLSEAAGAANMGVAEFNSACYYRYAALNLDLLFDERHLAALDPSERKQVVDAFIRATILAMPTARQNSMNAHVPPSYVLGLYKDRGQPMQLVNAFEKAIWARDGLVAKSVEALRVHHEDLKKTWSIPIVAETAIPDATLNEFCAELVSHV
ncbi:MAG: type I-E CRISPR-associated protein Cas7/Cse4/CasC [Kiritimatiellae bacterium]|nr:type I-E CRISPR-associated protein Cas7/Cse4/CasC [Kiritimatiellia bacterium]